MDAKEALEKIAEAVEGRAWCAGVGAMEWAGMVLSVLVQNPEWQDEFFRDPGEFLLSGKVRAENGRLTWLSRSGEIMSPAEYMRREWPKAIQQDQM